jgi:two-component system sensor histidine kinase KdpD
VNKKMRIQSLESTFFLSAQPGSYRVRIVLDTLLAAALTLMVTFCVYLFNLYPGVPNISILYLLVVLGLSCTRGLYASVIASLAAIISFDYFLVMPLYTFTVARPEEWLAFFIFLVTATITGQLAAALRQRAEQATERAREMQELYTLVDTATREMGIERRLMIVVQAIVKNFSAWGIYDCGILLPDKHGKVELLANAVQPLDQVTLSDDERKTIELVMREGRTIDLYGNNGTVSSAPEKPVSYRFRRGLWRDHQARPYFRLLPLRIESRIVGVVRLLVEEQRGRFPVERGVLAANDPLQHQIAFFWTFLDQAATMIERARLRREALQIEILQRTDALRAALLSSVSHDLRTPLASIKAAASSLLQEDVQWDDEARQSFARAIVRESDRLNRLVGNLLDMSRIEGGALRPEKEWYPFDELIHTVLDHMQMLLQGREIQVSLPADLAPVELDYLQIDQVLTNLLENAARYTPPQSPIELSTEEIDEPDQRYLQVSIADRGPGIPPYDLERIFDKFYRVSNNPRRTSSSVGSGLGLAVCRGLIEAHDGRIWAENRPDGGAIFRFTLPLRKVDAQINE